MMGFHKRKYIKLDNHIVWSEDIATVSLHNYPPDDPVPTLCIYTSSGSNIQSTFKSKEDCSKCFEKIAKHLKAF